MNKIAQNIIIEVLKDCDKKMEDISVSDKNKKMLAQASNELRELLLDFVELHK